MLTLSATCLAIALADQAGTLSLTEEQGRFGSFIAISDDRGLIEVALTQQEAADRINAIRERVA
jgi:hypothetical protein